MFDTPNEIAAHFKKQKESILKFDPEAYVMIRGNKMTVKNRFMTQDIPYDYEIEYSVKPRKLKVKVTNPIVLLFNGKKEDWHHKFPHEEWNVRLNSFSIALNVIPVLEYYCRMHARLNNETTLKF